jgi:serine/threonine-protein kinase
MRVNRELKLQAELRHRNIIAVLDFGPLDGDYFLVTEYARGGTLADLLDDHRTLPTMITARITSELLWGIDFAHERGVVHRDLKPGNILLGADGNVKIADFGLARSDLDPNQSTAGAIVGTPIYMAPEQAMGIGRDHRCDLFSVGTLVYEMTSGENPFQRSNDPLSLMAVVHVTRPPLLDAAPWAQPLLADLVDALHKAEPGQRPDSAAAVHTQIQRLVSASQRRYPQLLKDLVDDTAATVRKVATDEASLELERARALLGEGSALVPAAALAGMRAARLDPDNADAKEVLEVINQRWSYRMGGSEVAETKGLERRLEQSPGDVGLLRELWRRYKDEGLLERQRSVLEQIVRANPDDEKAKAALEKLAGADRLAPFGVR